jgi:hypothetical protein
MKKCKIHYRSQKFSFLCTRTFKLESKPCWFFIINIVLKDDEAMTHMSMMCLFDNDIITFS